MATNPILKELHAIRDEIMAEFGNDLGAYLKDSAERTKASDHPIARIKQRAVRRSQAAIQSELEVAK